MSPNESFKIGFLLGCADLGLDTDQTHALVKTAVAKTAGLGTIAGEMIEAPGRLVANMGPMAAQLGLLAGVGVPMAAGAGTGWAAAKLTDDDTDVDQAKADELLAEYRRLTDQANRQVAMKQFKGLPTHGGFRTLSGAA